MLHLPAATHLVIALVVMAVRNVSNCFVTTVARSLLHVDCTGYRVRIEPQTLRDFGRRASLGNLDAVNSGAAPYLLRRCPSLLPGIVTQLVTRDVQTRGRGPAQVQGADPPGGGKQFRCGWCCRPQVAALLFHPSRVSC
jgi:hypothetical protein